MGTRKYRYDPETGLLAPISVDETGRIQLIDSPLAGRAVRLLLIVAAVALSATVFSLAARGADPAGTSGVEAPP